MTSDIIKRKREARKQRQEITLIAIILLFLVVVLRLNSDLSRPQPEAIAALRDYYRNIPYVNRIYQQKYELNIVYEVPWTDYLKLNELGLFDFGEAINVMCPADGASVWTQVPEDYKVKILIHSHGEETGAWC